MTAHKRTKIALDENRMSILGVQILFGFQLNAPFQPQFASLPAHSQLASLVAFFLLVAAIAFGIAPSAYHRLLPSGRTESSLRHAVTWVNNGCLVLMAIAIGLDIYLVGERILNLQIGIVLGLAFGLVALVFWFGVELVHRSQHPNTQVDQGRESKPDLGQRIDYVLTEARVVLPGIQALLGFQLVVVLTNDFSELPIGAKWVHLVALLAIALSAVLLIAPAAHHRIVYGGNDAADFPRIASAYLLAATVFLAVGMAADCYVIVVKVLHSPAWSIWAAALTGAFCIGLWHVVPLLLRRRVGAQQR